MNASVASVERKVVILGTGGTIAGTADSATDSVGYRSASLGVDALVAAVPPLAGWPIECEQLAQLDSKDMTLGLWLTLVAAVQRQLQRPDVSGLVITHGTDTLEETAYFLYRVLAPHKPVVLTAAMRPATSLQADGPQNLLDAVTLARSGAMPGVLAVLGGRVFAAPDLRKQHGSRIDAFGAGDAGALALLQDGVLQRFREPPRRAPACLYAAGRCRGLALGGDRHQPRRRPRRDHRLAAGGRRAGHRHRRHRQRQRAPGAAAGGAACHPRRRAGGTRVALPARCGVFGAPADALPSYGALTPWQARIELMLDLLPATCRLISRGGAAPPSRCRTDPPASAHRSAARARR